MIVGAIWLLTAVAVTYLFKEEQQLGKELRSLHDWKGIVRSASGPEIIERIEATYPSKSDDYRRPDLVLNGLQSMCKMRESHVDLEAISSMLSQAEAHRMGFMTIAPNLLMLLGLLGTVLGLSSSIAPLAEQVVGAAENVDPQLLAQSLSTTLANMNSAFVATLWGIATAFSVGWRVRFVSGKQNALLEEVQDFIISDLGPKILPKSKEATIEDLTMAVKQVGKFIKTVPELMNQASLQFETAMSSTSEDIHGSLTALQEAAKQVTVELASSGETMREGADSLSNATLEMTAVAKDLDKYHQDLSNSHRLVLEGFENMRQQVEANVSEHMSSIDGFRREVMTGTSEIVQNLQLGSDRFAQCSADFKKASEESRSTVVEYREHVSQRFGDLQKATTELFEKHKTTAEEVARELNGLCVRLTPVAVASEWEKITSLVADLQETFRGLNLSVGESELSAMATSVRRIESALQEHASALRNLPARQEPQPESARLQPLVDEMRELNKSLREAANAYGAASSRRNSENISSSTSAVDSGHSVADYQDRSRTPKRSGWLGRIFRRKGGKRK